MALVEVTHFPFAHFLQSNPFPPFPMETELSHAIQLAIKQEKINGVLLSDKNGFCVVFSQIDPKLSACSASILFKASKISKEDVTIEIITTNKTFMIQKMDDLILTTCLK
jgi:hypothetical protein